MLTNPSSSIVWWFLKCQTFQTAHGNERLLKRTNNWMRGRIVFRQYDADYETCASLSRSFSSVHIVIRLHISKADACTQFWLDKSNIKRERERRSEISVHQKQFDASYQTVTTAKCKQTIADSADDWMAARQQKDISSAAHSLCIWMVNNRPFLSTHSLALLVWIFAVFGRLLLMRAQGNVLFCVCALCTHSVVWLLYDTCICPHNSYLDRGFLFRTASKRKNVWYAFYSSHFNSIIIFWSYSMHANVCFSKCT